MLNPLVWASSVIEFPRQTMLFWYNGAPNIVYPTSAFGYFKNLNNPCVYSILEYIEGANMGNPRYKPVRETKIIRQCKSKEPEFKFIKASKQVTVPASSEMLFNLGAVNTGYRYPVSPFNPYYIWHNSLKTVVELTSLKRTGSNRHKFLFMNLPYNIPTRELINKHLGEPKRSMFSNFTDQTFFNVLELFRFVSGEYKHLSILATTLQEDEFKYIDLILNINNKSVIINLEMLASITDAFVIETKLKKYKSSTTTKLMYVFLKRILESAPLVSSSDINKINNVHGITGGTKDIDLDTATEDKVSLDDIIANELTDSDIPEQRDPDVDEMIETGINEMVSEDIIADIAVLTPEELSVDLPLTDHTKVIKTIESLTDSNIISKKTRDSFKDILAQQAVMPSPYRDGTKLADMLTYSAEEVALDDVDTTVKDSPAVIDKTMNKNPLAVINKKYRDKTMKKDILSTLYSIQRGGVLVKEHEIMQKKSVLGETEEHKLVVRTINGGQSTIRVILPVVREDNTIKLSGNTYVMRKQRADIPLKKISNSEVSINSNYGKLFISRGKYKKDDLGFWFQKQLLAKYEVDKDLKNIAAISVAAPDANVPRDYGVIGRYIKGFEYKGIIFSFEYKSRATALRIDNIDKLEKNAVLVGSKKGVPVVMDFNNQLFLLDGDKIALGTIYDYLDINMAKSPIEFCNARVFKRYIPIAVLLSYYIGFKDLIRLLKVNYTIIETGKRVLLADDQYRVIFSDVTYVITRDYGIGDLTLAGFRDIVSSTKLIPVTALESKSKFMTLFTAMDLPILYVNEIKLMETMFLDPITKQVLELYKQPTTFHGVLLKATEMLQDDNYIHPNSIDGVVLKGYERISAMMYLELVNAMRANANRSHFGKSNIVVNPYAVLNRINEDSTKVLVDDLNPIASLKQHEDVTYLGSHGRSEETMSENTRIMHESEIGIISEAVKDSGAVGISSYLSASPKINSTRGTVDKYSKEDGWASVLSPSAMLAPFATKDDPKRTNFVSIQNAHIIPMANMRAPYVRTGYESIAAVRSSDKFVISAIEDGKVESVSDTEIVVIYKESGKRTYSLKEWTSKEEAGVCYTHRQVPNVKRGAAFKKDDALAYDEAFFEPDIFDKSRVIYKQGSSYTVALMEAPETYEDSGGISSDMAKLMRTIVTKTKSITIANTDNIIDAIGIGGKVEPRTPLLSIADEALANVSDLDEKALEILKGLRMLSPKAGYRGVVSKIQVFYNCELNELSPTLKKLAIASDKELIASTGSSGKVDSSYSIQGVPLLIGSVEIKYYIKVETPMGTADKAIMANQLKFTVGEVFNDPIFAEDGTPIDAKFSTRSIEARIVNSPGLIGTTSKLLEVVANKAIEQYFN